MAEMTASNVVLLLLTGGGIAGISSFATVWLTKRYEERRHIRELENTKSQHLRDLLFKTALDVWSKEAELKNKNIDRCGPLGGSTTVYSPESYVLRMAKLLDVIQQGNIDKATAEKCMAEVKEIWKISIS